MDSWGNTPAIEEMIPGTIELREPNRLPDNNFVEDHER